MCVFVYVLHICNREGNRRSGVALAMRHRLCGLSTYGLNGFEREMSTPPTLRRGTADFTFFYCILGNIGFIIVLSFHSIVLIVFTGERRLPVLNFTVIVIMKMQTTPLRWSKVVYYSSISTVVSSLEALIIQLQLRQQRARSAVEASDLPNADATLPHSHQLQPLITALQLPLNPFNIRILHWTAIRSTAASTRCRQLAWMVYLHGRQH